jgi:uncharacterized protein
VSVGFAFGDSRRPPFNKLSLEIVGRQAVTSFMATEAFARANSPKKLHWIDGASHVDLYDKPEYVGPAVEKLAEFFTDQLA